MRANRKRDKHVPTDDHEKSELRSLLRGISGHAQQVALQFSSEVDFLFSDINQNQVETLFGTTNWEQVKNIKRHRHKIHRINLHNVRLFAWCEATAGSHWGK